MGGRETGFEPGRLCWSPSPYGTVSTRRTSFDGLPRNTSTSVKTPCVCFHLCPLGAWGLLDLFSLYKTGIFVLEMLLLSVSCNRHGTTPLESNRTPCILITVHRFGQAASTNRVNVGLNGKWITLWQLHVIFLTLIGKAVVDTTTYLSFRSLFHP